MDSFKADKNLYDVIFNKLVKLALNMTKDSDIAINNTIMKKWWQCVNLFRKGTTGGIKYFRDVEVKYNAQNE